jgi:hypothetical protein
MLAVLQIQPHYASATDTESSIVIPYPSQARENPCLLLQSYRLRGCRYVASESSATQNQDGFVAIEIRDRVNELREAGIDPYPRQGTKYPGCSLSRFERTYHTLKNGESKKGTMVGSCQGTSNSCLRNTDGQLRLYRTNRISPYSWQPALLRGHSPQEFEASNSRQSCGNAWLSNNEGGFYREPQVATARGHHQWVHPDTGRTSPYKD